ncbi:hypothetical protein ACH4Q7_34660 [Streptomyces roseolus]|uniref:hypothetical protein n=1 Tax=Streptomyces roseolus TaxID=67358 RepID=UPI0037AEED45
MPDGQRVVSARLDEPPLGTLEQLFRDRQAGLVRPARGAGGRLALLGRPARGETAAVTVRPDPVPGDLAAVVRAGDVGERLAG